MSEHQANQALELQAKANEWKKGKHFDAIPPKRVKPSFWSKLIKFFSGK